MKEQVGFAQFFLGVGGDYGDCRDAGNEVVDRRNHKSDLTVAHRLKK